MKLPKNCYYYTQPIQKGSFEKEQYRLQIPSLVLFIEEPWRDMVPEISPHYGIPAPVTTEYIENYFVEYLMNPELSENETYRYSSRICHRLKAGDTQIERVIKILKETPFTNQAVIEIGSPDDFDVCVDKHGRYDPPCLRLLDFKVIPFDNEKVLTLTAYFRSWDLWAGLPANLGGLELLKQYVAMEANLKNGPLYAYSAGAHIYGYQVELVKTRFGIC